MLFSSSDSAPEEPSCGPMQGASPSFKVCDGCIASDPPCSLVVCQGSLLRRLKGPEPEPRALQQTSNVQGSHATQASGNAELAQHLFKRLT